jgi:hypothetical protein
MTVCKLRICSLNSSANGDTFGLERTHSLAFQPVHLSKLHFDSAVFHGGKNQHSRTGFYIGLQSYEAQYCFDAAVIHIGLAAHSAPVLSALGDVSRRVEQQRLEAGYCLPPHMSRSVLMEMFPTQPPLHDFMSWRLTKYVDTLKFLHHPTIRMSAVEDAWSQIASEQLSSND